MKKKREVENLQLSLCKATRRASTAKRQCCEFERLVRKIVALRKGTKRAQRTSRSKHVGPLTCDSWYSTDLESGRITSDYESSTGLEKHICLKERKEYGGGGAGGGLHYARFKQQPFIS